MNGQIQRRRIALDRRDLLRAAAPAQNAQAEQQEYGDHFRKQFVLDIGGLEEKVAKQRTGSR